jgi:hypothetical protein
MLAVFGQIYAYRMLLATKIRAKFLLGQLNIVERMVKKICRLYFNSIVFLVSKKQVEISE